MNAAWQQREEVRRHRRAQPHNRNLRKAVKMVGQNLRKVRDIATDVADVMLSTAVELAPRSKRPCGAQGSCAGAGTEAEMNAAWQQRGGEEAPTCTSPQQQPSKGHEDGWTKSWEGSQGCRAELFVGVRLQTRNTHSRRRPDRLLHSNTMNLDGNRDHSSAFVKDEDSVLLQDVELIRERWIQWFHTLFNGKLPKLDLNIVDQWPENMPLGVQSTMQDLAGAILSLTSPLSWSRSPSTVIPPCAGDSSISSLVFGGGARCRSSRNMLSSWYSIQEHDRTDCGNYRGISLVGHAGKILPKIITRHLFKYCEREGVQPEKDRVFQTNRFTTDMMFDLSATGVGAKETHSVVCMLYRPYQSVRMLSLNPPLNSTRPFWRGAEYDLGHSSIPRYHASMRVTRRQGMLGVVCCRT